MKHYLILPVLLFSTTALPVYAQDPAPDPDLETVEGEDSAPPADPADLLKEPGEPDFEDVGSTHEQSPAWFSCAADEDCNLVEELCGRKAAINKKFTTEFNAWRDHAKAETDCSGLAPTALGGADFATCRNGQCVAQREGHETTDAGE